MQLGQSAGGGLGALAPHGLLSIAQWQGSWGYSGSSDDSRWSDPLRGRGDPVDVTPTPPLGGKMRHSQLQRTTSG